jgi:predicted membrane chloride channel (bestrophin family)
MKPNSKRFLWKPREETLVEFNNIQGRCERIKNTPFPRQYSFFSRVFVFIHAFLLPFVFVEEIGWATIPGLSSFRLCSFALTW